MDTAMKEDEKADLDQAWSRRVAAIAVETLIVAEPPLLSLTPEQIVRCTDIMAEEFSSA